VRLIGEEYCSEGYVSLLEENHVLIAERVNGIIKDEYLNRYHYSTLKGMEEKLSQVVSFYNNERPHTSCSMFTPNNVHQQNLQVERKWKTYYRSKKSPTVP